ncbi:MAG TPA: hypothetical protein VHA14_03195, partial [Bryobacteraceae bacterium]|nr:hypothetical protein [Bryobacteraceae bacterium]
NRWQFPMLLQCGASVRKVSPFVEFGPSISAMVGGRSTYSSTNTNPPAAPTVSSSRGSFPAVTTAGITAGGGIAIPVRGHHLRAELRFSHWFSTRYPATNALLGVIYPVPVSFTLPAVSSPLVLQANEASFLLGFSF